MLFLVLFDISQFAFGSLLSHLTEYKVSGKAFMLCHMNNSNLIRTDSEYVSNRENI